MLLMTEFTSFAWRSRLLATRLRRSSQTASGSPTNIAAIISEMTPTFQPAPARLCSFAMFSLRRRPGGNVESGLEHMAPAEHGQRTMTPLEPYSRRAPTDFPPVGSADNRSDQLAELLDPKLPCRPLALARQFSLALAQFDASDLARDRLRQFAEFDPPYPFVGREPLFQELENRQRGGPVGAVTGRQDDIGLGHGQPRGIGGRHDRGLGDRLVLDQRALEFEGTEAIIVRFEHVVGAADKGDVAGSVARGDVAGSVIVALERAQAAVVVLIALHQTYRPGRERDRDLAMIGLEPFGVEERDAITRQRAPHRARDDPLANRIADHHRRLGLAIGIA